MAATDVETAPGLAVVFGGSGFVGAQVVRALARRGWRVRIAVRKPHLAHDLRMQGDVGQVLPIRCDVTRPEDVEAAMAGADLAINLVGALYESPWTRFQTLHVDAAAAIAGACARNGARLVQVSAIGADAASGSAYARTKAQGEAAVRAALPDAVIVRPSIVFGDGDGFLNRFARMAAVAPALPLIGWGRTRFQPVYVGDLAEAIARVATRPSAAGRTFEVGGPSVYTFEEILKLILRETNRSRLLLPLPFPVARIIGSLAQLTAIAGIAPPLTRDQVVMLQRDNVVADGAEGLETLGVTPTGLEAIAPAYLWRYRRGGQYAERPAPVAAA